jgi:hypothetical protein
VVDALAKLTLAMRPKACLLSVCLTVQTADATCATSYPGMPASSPILPLSHFRLCMPIISSLFNLVAHSAFLLLLDVLLRPCVTRVDAVLSRLSRDEYAFAILPCFACTDILCQPPSVSGCSRSASLILIYNPYSQTISSLSMYAFPVLPQRFGRTQSCRAYHYVGRSASDGADDAQQHTTPAVLSCS